MPGIRWISAGDIQVGDIILASDKIFKVQSVGDRNFPNLPIVAIFRSSTIWTDAEEEAPTTLRTRTSSGAPWKYLLLHREEEST